MRKIVMLCAGILTLSISALAQDLPKYEAFAGYSYVHFSISPGSGGGNNITSNENGANGGVTFYPSRWLGFVGDFGDYKISTLNQGGSSPNLPNGSLAVSGKAFTYLAGPRIRFPMKNVTPFAQILLGGSHLGNIWTDVAAACRGGIAPCQVNPSDNVFAMTTEGGVDIAVARHLAIRGQGGYLMTRFHSGGGSNRMAETQNNVRVSVGIVVH